MSSRSSRRYFRSRRGDSSIRSAVSSGTSRRIYNRRTPSGSALAHSFRECAHKFRLRLGVQMQKEIVLLFGRQAFKPVDSLVLVKERPLVQQLVSFAQAVLDHAILLLLQVNGALLRLLIGRVPTNIGGSGSDSQS